MPRKKDCIRCHYIDDVCRNCGRVKGQPKGAAREPNNKNALPEVDPAAGLNFDPVQSIADNAPFDPVPSSDASSPSMSSETAPAVAEARPTSAAVATEQSVLPPAATSAATPEHSPIGGSSAERYLRCSASVELLKLVKPDAGDEEWTQEGTRAHALAAECLEQACDAYMYLGVRDNVTPEMCLAVQIYIDYVRSRPGRIVVEHKMHCPDIHEFFYGTIDCAIYPVMDAGVLEIVDYKNGAGVIVDVVNNAQLQFYAAGFIMKNGPFPDDMPVRLTIVQPNAWHADGRIRTWETTVSAVMRWLNTELVPGIEATQSLDGWFFNMGEHCRFCPAKIACPAFANLKEKVVARRAIATYEEIEFLQMLIKQYKKDAFARLTAGELPELVGAKLVYGKANRVWKDGADQQVYAVLGETALTKPELLSPAQIEELPGGSALVAQWAYKPEGAPTIASVNDKRTEAPSNLGSQVWGGEHFQKSLATTGA